jgi:hypothetical protein
MLVTTLPSRLDNVAEHDRLAIIRHRLGRRDQRSCVHQAYFDAGGLGILIGMRTIPAIALLVKPLRSPNDCRDTEDK